MNLWPETQHFRGVGVEWAQNLEEALVDNLDQVSIVELIPENFFGGRNPEFLKRLRESGLPAMIHGVELSIGSDEPLKQSHLDQMFAIADQVRTVNFGDHLCFTEAGGIEIGQLTPIPQTQRALDAVCRKIDRVKKQIPYPLILENITHRFQIPGPEMTEPEFLNTLFRRTGAYLLLDLNNVHTNATNFGFDPKAWLDELDMNCVLGIHLAGGMIDEEGDLLDSHNRSVPEPVWDLYRQVAHRIRPACAIVEWTEDPPPFGLLLEDVDRARAILSEVRR